MGFLKNYAPASDIAAGAFPVFASITPFYTELARSGLAVAGYFDPNAPGAVSHFIGARQPFKEAKNARRYQKFLGKKFSENNENNEKDKFWPLFNF